MFKLLGIGRIQEKITTTEYLSDNKEEIDEQEDTTSTSGDLDNIFSDMIYENDYYQLYKCDAREVCVNVPIWSSQRPLNTDHINTLARDIKTSGYVMGTFKIIKCEDEYRIFDGQHRYHALREIFLKDNSFDTEIIAEVYIVDDLDSPEALTLFAKANTIKNVEVKDTPNVIAHNVVKYFSQKYPHIFVDSVSRVNRPRIDKKIFYQKMKSILDEISQENPNTDNSFPKTADEVIKSIESKNCYYSLKPRNGYRSKGISDAMYNKAKDSKFYLGLENMDDWLNSLQ